MKKGKLQCKDIDDVPILEFLNYRRIKGLGWACWYEGYDNSVPFPESVSSKLKIAKMASLIRRRMVTGCPCGCRGDYEITGKGIEYLVKINSTT